MTTETNQGMVISKITAYGCEMILACDGNCSKAWGISQRPQIVLDETDEEDFAYLADNELGLAPDNPGTEEGGHTKPSYPVHNKWCFRECERLSFCQTSKFPDLNLKNLQERQYNQPWKHQR